MDKAEIIRLSEVIGGFSNWLKDTMDKTIYKPYPMPNNIKTTLKRGIKNLINQILNNDNELAIKAIEPLYILKDRIGQFYWDYTVWLLAYAPETDKEMQEWNDSYPYSSLRFGEFDYSKDRAYLSLLSDIEYELRVLSNYFQSREQPEEVKRNIPQNKKGRRNSSFREFFTSSYASRADEIINLMKTQIGNRSGINAAIVLIAALKNGYIKNLEQGATDREFGRQLIVRKYFKKYLSKEQSPDLWASREVEEMQQKLKI